MTNVKRTAYRLALLALVYWGASEAFGLYQVHFPNRNHPMIPELQDMQTYCVGNYLIDLPRRSEAIRLETRTKGNRYATIFALPGTSRDDFERRVAERWRELKDLKNDGPTTFEQPSQRFEVMPEAVAMTFRHHTMDLKGWPGGGSGPRSFYETEGYLRRDGILYVFNSSLGKEGVINAMKTMQVRKDDVIPVGEGFCGGLSFFPGRPDDNDFVWFAFRLPVEPHMEFRIELPTGQSSHPELPLFESDEIKVRKLRMAKRSLAGISGEEWMEYVWQNESEATYQTSLSAAWFGPGDGEFGFPGIQLRLDTSSTAKDVPPPKVGEMITVRGKRSMKIEDFGALWDGIAATLRVRPGAF